MCYYVLGSVILYKQNGKEKIMPEKSTPIYFNESLKNSIRRACIKEKTNITRFVCEAVQEKLDKIYKRKESVDVCGE